MCLICSTFVNVYTFHVFFLFLSNAKNETERKKITKTKNELKRIETLMEMMSTMSYSRNKKVSQPNLKKKHSKSKFQISETTQIVQSQVFFFLNLSRIAASFGKLRYSVILIWYYIL